jgi:hypothetical protein
MLADVGKRRIFSTILSSIEDGGGGSPSLSSRG